MMSSSQSFLTPTDVNKSNMAPFKSENPSSNSQPPPNTSNNNNNSTGAAGDTKILGTNSDMPVWYYEKADFRKTPSIKDGMSYEQECRYRRESARFIIQMGLEMKLRYDTMATGVVYMHRFYMRHSFKPFSRYVTAASCLFLAGKVEETPKKCKDILKIAKDVMSDQQFLTFGEDPKETVMIMERILLQTINFDLQVDHPYKHLLKYAKSLRGADDDIQKMVQMAWTFINDSLCTTICLQWEPEIVAIAVMFLAGKLSKFEMTTHGHQSSSSSRRNQFWWEPFVENVTVDMLEDICHQILDLYTMAPTVPDPNVNQPVASVAPHPM